MSDVITELKKSLKQIPTLNYVLSFLLLITFLLINWTLGVSRIFFEENVFYAFEWILKNPTILFYSFPLSFHARDILVASAFTFFFFITLKDQLENKKKFRKGKEHGSARWGKQEDISPFIDYTKDGDISKNNIILSQSEYISLPRPKEWWAERNHNVEVIGGSGQGKSRNVVEPNLMQMHSSYVVADPKGAIFNHLAYMFIAHGYDVKVFNIKDMEKSLHYNPFSYIEREDDILTIVNTIMDNTEGKGEQKGEDFWVKAERLLYQALIGAIYYYLPYDEQNIPTLMRLLNMCSNEESDDGETQNRVDMWFEMIEKDHGETYPVKMYKEFNLGANKTKKSILISCAARLSMFNIQQVSELVKDDELELDTLGDKKTVLFLIMSDTNKTYNFLISMLYSQLFDLLCNKADAGNGTLDIPVRCIIDEFANIGKIPDIEIKIATIRSRGISLMIILQSSAQLKSKYKDDADIIEDNCDSLIFLGGKSKSTAKEITEMLGKETIDDSNTGETKAQSDSHNINYSKLGRELMTIDEIITMPKTECIVQISGLRPFKSKKYDLTKHPKFKYYASNKKHPYWMEVEQFITVYREKGGFAGPSVLNNKANHILTHKDTFQDTNEEKFDVV